ncbi:uncharacterized protein LOC132725407 [Ruditapes philippinarum]|uniref:uncharacterized protein LOC132725407 n=1 Tax=Ruditapes philippinarum TaxID=129788 RepID=UPI00295B55C4|nr:uncharacterized protein LOC132725407 [Ruditapes philippinarum]
MKVTVFLVVMLVVGCLSTDDILRRGSDSNSKTKRWDHSFNTKFGRENGVPYITGEYTLGHDNFETSIHGTVSGNGNWEVGASVEWRFKRNAKTNGKKLYNVSFQIDPCDFVTYDLDKNDEIVLGEMHAIFGDSEMALRLYIDMDGNGNAVIEKEEFYRQAPQFIKECTVLDPKGED